MIKSLVAGVAALALMGAAAMAENVDSVSRTVTQSTPAGTSTSSVKIEKSADPLTGATTEKTETYRGSSGSSAATSTITTVNPDVFNPSRVTTYHEERTLSPGPQTVEKTYTTQSTSPVQQTTTYNRSTTVKTGD